MRTAGPFLTGAGLFLARLEGWITKQWFKLAGLLFVPKTVPGWLLCGAALLFDSQVIWAVDRQSHYGSDTLYGVFPFWVPTLLAFR